MRKFAKLLLTTVCILCLAVLSVGCLEEVDDDSSSSATHVHVAEDDWHSDGEYHWQLCAECGEEMNKGEHVFTELNVAAQPAKTAYTVGETFDKTGMKIEGECVCGNIEITDYTVAYQTENAQVFSVSDTHVVVSYGELFVNVSVTVGKIKLEKPAADATNFVYNGDEQTYDIAENERYTVSGNKQTNAGSYSVTVALKDTANVSWADGATDNLTYTFVIAKLAIEKPAADTTNFVYNGDEQTYDIAENERYTVSGNKQTNVGSYSVTVALKDTANVSWADGSPDNLTYTFVIAKLAIEKPAADTRNFVYNGSEQTYDIAASERYTVSGNKQTNAGNYTVTVALKDAANISWADGTTENLTYTFAIAKAENVIEWAKNEKNEYISLDIVHGSTPNPQATATSGTTVTFTFANKDKTKTGGWASVYEHPTQYVCIAAVAESENYNAATLERMFTVFKAANSVDWAKDENGYITLDTVYGIAPNPQVTVSGGEITYTYYKAVLTDGQFTKTEKLNAWSTTDCGAGLYCCVVTVAESDDYNSATMERYFTVNKAQNEITYKTNENGDILGLDFVYGNAPIENTAMSKAGALTYTYTLVNKDSTGNPVEPAADAVYAPWSDANISGIYMCKIVAEETDNYTSVIAYRWVRVHKADNTIEWAKNGNEFITLDIVYGETPNPQVTVKGGATVTFTYYKAVLSDGQFTKTDKLDAWSTTDCGAGLYCCVVTVAESDNYNSAATERFFTVNKAENEITYKTNENGNILSLDFVYGSGPIENTAISKAGALTYTYTLVNKDSTGNPVEPAADAVYAPWSDANISGIYMCKIVAEETDNYTSVIAYRWVRVHKREFDENGVKYAYYENNEKTIQVYYVSGYNGTSSEVNVLATFNDGAHGEKPVKFVGFEAFIHNNTITKVILPSTLDSLEGSAFLGCTNLEYVSMRGVKTMNWASIYNKENGDNNFRNCNRLKHVIIGESLSSNCGQFNAEELPAVLTLCLYVDGADGAVNLVGNNALWSGKVFYKGNSSECGKWNYNADGEIVSTSHNFVNGKCSNCGIYNTAGVKYAYNSEKQVYYVTGCASNVTEVVVLSAYSDGTNPEKPVKYVGASAFRDNVTITKVILPESVDSLEGSVFWGCENLEYVSMTGITNLEYASPYGGGRNNNFRNCFKLKIVVVSNALYSNVGQFGCAAADPGNKKILDFYVVGSSGAPSLDYETADANNLCSGNVYYYSETAVAGCWHYDESGNAVLWN